MANWSEIGTAVGAFVTGLGAYFVASGKGRRPAKEDPQDTAQCVPCKMEGNVSELREEMTEGFHRLNERLNDTEAHHETTNSKIEDMGADIKELFTIARETSKDLNQLIGMVKAQQGQAP